MDKISINSWINLTASVLAFIGGVIPILWAIWQAAKKINKTDMLVNKSLYIISVIFNIIGFLVIFVTHNTDVALPFYCVGYIFYCVYYNLGEFINIRLITTNLILQSLSLSIMINLFFINMIQENMRLLINVLRGK